MTRQTEVATPVSDGLPDYEQATCEQRNAQAWRYFVNLLTCLYMLVLIIFSMMIEVSPVWRNDIWLAETIFFFFMYGIGIFYLVYCYIFMIHPEGFNFFIRLMQKYSILRNAERWKIRRSSHTGEGASTLYLRLGNLFFGAAALVLFAMEIFLCSEQSTCRKSNIAKHVVGMIFTFIQMHFIFCNSKIAVRGSKRFSKFGMMHLIAVNLWTWFRFAVYKQVAKVLKKKKKVIDSSSSSSSSEEEDLEELAELDGVKVVHGFLSEVTNQTIEAVLNMTQNTESSTNPYATSTTTLSPVRLMAFDHFSEVATFLTTCTVEFSILAAAVMFIIWGTIDHEGHHHHQHHSGEVKRPSRMRLDCSNAHGGIFGGICFLIIVFVTIGVYCVFEDLKNNFGANLVFGIVDQCLFGIALGACLIGMWRMRLLQYRLHAHGEVIDEILLVIGLVGELIYCVIGIDVFIESRRRAIDRGSLLPIFVFVTRLFQVLAQTAYILTVSRLRCLTPYALKFKPGKQAIAFLLICNIALFFFQTFESMKLTYGIDHPSDVYATIIYAIGPLLVFYRFHSSACLAETWKITYSGKEAEHAHSLSRSQLSVETAEEVVEP